MPGHLAKPLDVSIRSRLFGPGDTPVACDVLGIEPVSIRSRRLGREILDYCRVALPDQNCFNPLPAVRPGDTGYYPCTAPSGTETVSIRSRRLGREIRRKVTRSGPSAKSFNPLPAVRPGDTIMLDAANQVSQSFNPLPAVRPGDTQ